MSKTKFYIFSLIKCICITLIITILSITFFALLLKIFSLNNGVIKPVNYLIKTLSVFIGTLFSVRGNKGAVKGLILGGISTIFCYVFFSILSGNFQLTLSFIWDVCLGLIVGAVGGITAVNFKK